MADWAPCYHWFTSDTAGASALESRIAAQARRSGWGDRWAARIGRAWGRVLQVQTATPWGMLLLEGADVEVCPANDFLAGSGRGVFFPAFNYMYSVGEGAVALDGVAELLGAGARAWRRGSHSILALDRPIPFTHATQQIRLDSTLRDPSSMARLVEALALGAERALTGRPATLLLGLRTPRYGCTHLGHMHANLESPRRGVFQIEVTGEHNQLTNVREVGPSLWALTRREPAPGLSDEAWPFAESQGGDGA